ncbi:ribonuclease HII [Pneumocystis carinii B80]|uniref:Ribonuclease n=1 Tax=Pneumocystis carinii (strain B80) TaxID=1408658 RepID=A0A0W4ZCN6_PNEC8|nr:ribonuclease HII [Pneumocystis carinii B80]KTW26150.1 ribonuclease HII [Pneumocystis carinii B80]
MSEDYFSEKSSKKDEFLTTKNDFYIPTEGIIHSGNKLCHSGAWIAGIDEAGRGPVLGPMVYSIAYCKSPYEKNLKKHGFFDSKTLTPERREELFEELYRNEELRNNVGWSIRIISAREISQGMLQSNKSYNLNAQAHDTTIQLLDEVIKRGFNIKEIYVDTVGPSSSYQTKLQQLFPQIDVIVKEKADSIYPIVSIASICAKVTRDKALAMFAVNGESWGSGYPSDPKTCEWLRCSIDPIFGWPYEIVRYSWQTAKDLLEKDAQMKNNSKVHVEWYNNNEADNTKKIQCYFQTSKITQEGFDLSWYGDNVELSDF